jgi:hypothetical protein
VIEARSSEPLAEALGETLVLAEDYADQDRPSLTADGRREGAVEPLADPIREAAQPAAVADDPPLVAVEHDVDAVTTQPGSLVEAARGSARERDHAKDLEDRSLRGRAPEREL